MRNLTISAPFWRLKVKFSARFIIFLYRQWNWIITVVACPCAEPWNPSFNIKFRKEHLVINKIKAKLSRDTVSLRAGQLITASRQDRSKQSLYYVVQFGSMLWVFEWDPVVWPFKWNLLSISWELGFFLQRGFDVFNALDLMENKEFLEKLKFGIGDGNLQYYLYNWKCPFMEPEKVSYIALFYMPVILPWVWKAVCETLKLLM